jgi:SAM-dependent methyltransferase
MNKNNNYSVNLLKNEYLARKLMREIINKTVHRHVSLGGAIAELGSGLGHNLDLLATDYRVIGFDGLEDAAKIASERGINTVKADLDQELPVEAESFDAILCIDVLEHLIDPLACINEAFRLLKPSKFLIINVPNHFTLTCRIRILMGKGIDAPKFFPNHHAWNYPHVRFFNHQSIIKAANLCGFILAEDLSDNFPAVPFISRMHFFKYACCKLAKFFPNLFGGGFLLVFRKSINI